MSEREVSEAPDVPRIQIPDVQLNTATGRRQSEQGEVVLHPLELFQSCTMSDPLTISRSQSHGGESSASDSELHPLEVVFDPENDHRRKSSLVSSEATKLTHQHKSTACFVHALLENQGKGRNKGASLDSDLSKAIDGKISGNNDHDGSTHSRLLTKRQLADMAWGVRELSKRLGSLRLNLHVKTVFLLTKAHDETLIQYTREVARWLLSKDRKTDYIVYVEKTLEHNKKFDALSLVAEDPSYKERLRYWTNELCAKRPQLFDFAVTLGGDGTVLYASWLFQRRVPPVLSFALGSLGFLTKFDYETFPETLSSAFHDGVTVSLRLRFEGTVMRSQRDVNSHAHKDLVEELVGEEQEDARTHRPAKSYMILNDVVVDRGPNPTMSSIELFGDDQHFTTVQADGICVATPTGSTAYNLAAGGSLCYPDNPVILVSAICPHTLSFRPIILPDTMVLRVGVPYDARTSSWASFDGRERVELQPGDYVTISASRYPFATVMPQGRENEDWVAGIRRTLQWNSRERQKSFKEWSKE
ncbi:MAG: hypothetical protein M4579_001373 [Chaenotheca gracillima]|nr:MAG: hypothetical protein M4579_001373 [Chaenotheca gracillima]